MTNKQKYRQFCQKEPPIPLFSKDWWLDAVCGDENWDVVIVEKGGIVVGSLPYYLTRTKGFLAILMPNITQTMGVYIKYPKGQKYYKRLSWEKTVMTELISGLPSFDIFVQNFDRRVTNWLPFFWSGFQQTVRYTYVIENIAIEDLEKNFETDIRRRRRRAHENGVEVVESDDIEKFYELNVMTFERQQRKVPYSLDFIKKLYKACKQKNAVRIYFAKLGEDIIAASFLVSDDNTVYYLMGGIDPDFKSLGGMDIVQFEGIKYALKNNKSFDFEGSMIESIEKYFRSFGAIQKPYFQISKTNSKLLKTAYFIKDIMK